MSNKITTQRARIWQSAAIALALAFGGLALTTPAVAGNAVETRINAAAQGYAAQGYDVVAYFFNDRPRLGMDDFTHVHDGQVYRFINQTNQQAFKANPAKYAPAYAGYSAQGVAAGRKLPGNPQYWTIFGNRLYLNHDAASHDEFAADPASYIAFADTQWHFLRGDRISALPLPGDGKLTANSTR
jgi:hypothetical protein